MKAVLIIHNAAIDADVNDILESVGAKHYTKFTGVLGKGEMSEPHLDIEVWPETNSATLVVTGEQMAKALVDAVRSRRADLGTEGLKAFIWDILEVT